MSPWAIRLGHSRSVAEDDTVEESTLIDAPRPARLAPGGALAAAAVLLATVGVARALGSLVPLVGAPAFALLLGMALRLVYAPDAAARRVLRFSSHAARPRSAPSRGSSRRPRSRSPTRSRRSS